MKGVILAGGKGVRLQPLTKVISKALLTVYNKPLIMYPLQTLIDSGIRDILVVVPKGKIKEFENLLGDGREFGVRISYVDQKEPKGMADAVICAKKFVGKDNVFITAADNVYDGHFREAVKKFKGGCRIFVKKVSDPERFGVVKFNKNKPVDIVEKPKKFISNYAAMALYIFDGKVFNIAKTLKPSWRGELEITDIIREYLRQEEIKLEFLKNKIIDAGTFDSLLEANIYIAKKEKAKRG